MHKHTCLAGSFAIALAGASACGDGGGGAGTNPGSGGAPTGGGGASGSGAGGSGGTGVTSPPPVSTYYPLKVGNWWKYRISDPSIAPWEKTVTAEAQEPVGGTGPSAMTPAIRVMTKKGANDMTINWQGRVAHADGSIWVRYRETAYAAGTGNVNVEDWWSPHRLRFDERTPNLVKGATYQEAYQEFTRRGTGPAAMTNVTTGWQVKDVNQTVTVPIPGATAKSYPDCIEVAHTLASGATSKTFWFCRGIGKVKETGGQTEELIDHLVVWP